MFIERQSLSTIKLGRSAMSTLRSYRACTQLLTFIYKHLAPTELVNSRRAVTARCLILAASRDSVRAVVRELHVYAEVFLLEQRDDLLQGVAILARDAHKVAVDLRLHFE